MKKKVIYIASAVLVLALGIIIGILLSKGGDDIAPDNRLASNENSEVSGNGSKSISDTEKPGNIEDGVSNDADKIPDSEIKASDIGKPIMPQDKNAGDVTDGSGGDHSDSGSIDSASDNLQGNDTGTGNTDLENNDETDVSGDKNTGNGDDNTGINDETGKSGSTGTGKNTGKTDDTETGNTGSEKNTGTDIGGEKNSDNGNGSDVNDETGNTGNGSDGTGKNAEDSSVNDNKNGDNGSGKNNGTNAGGNKDTGDKDSDSAVKDENGNTGNGNGGSSDTGSGNKGSENTGSGNEGTGNSGSGSSDSGKENNNNGENKGQDVIITKPVAVINTGKLTETGSGYEGVKGTGKYNYGEALQKSVLFYELQRSGKLPEKVRCNWRGDSGLNDGKDNGLDLTGGWYDAGDNVKFNLPMSYTSSMLGWSIIEDAAAYEESGQLSYALGNIKWANDYFIKCHPSDEVYYYQVGDGNQDHSYWGAAETVEYRMSRPSYKVTKSNPGSAVCGETAASLAICSIIYKNIDKSYSDLCLKHAKSLYKFARDTKSDAGYTAANGFYNSWSGFYDELAWSAAWLYCATGDDTYISNAEADYKNAGHDYDWAMCWDDVHIGAAVMLAKLTDKAEYKNEVEKHLDWWSGVSSDHITYSPKGLAWLDSWGSLRYATTTSFIALSYVESGACTSSKVKAYTEFAENQANYALGSSGRSYVVGFGENAPKNPHHRTAQGSYCDNMNEPNPARHTLYGALVGGPDANDGYADTVSDYNKNEVACDYNAGFIGLLAKMYKKYHGQTLKDFGAVEPIDVDEFYVQGGINVDGNDFIEIKALICNVSAWPARGGESLEYRYYVDLSEVYNAGGSASDIAVTTNYMAAGKAAGLKVWDEDKHIYYLSVDFSDSVIYPGGQDKYKKEIQVRLRNPNGTWDNSNDPSFKGMTKGGNAMLTSSALYENGKLVFGSEPAKGKNSGKTVTAGDGSGNSGSGNNGGNGTGNGGSGNNTGNGSGNSGSGNNGGNGTGSGNNGGSNIDIKGTAKNESVSVSIEYDSISSSSSGISGRMNIVNNSDGTLAVKDLKILFYFTNEDAKPLTFECYHTCINGASGSYTQLSGCSGKFEDAKGKNADTVCEITYSDSNVLGEGDSLACNFAIHHTDWSNMNLTNDYSISDAANIVILSGKKQISGKKPE